MKNNKEWFKIERSGLPYDPKKEKRKKNRIMKYIITFLLFLVVVAFITSRVFLLYMKDYVAVYAVDNTINSTWIGSLASYWGGIIGGISSGVFAFFGVFFTIKYYKESDALKEKAAIQPFLLVSVCTNDRDKQKENLIEIEKNGKQNMQEIAISIKNIGNGFANILTIHTGETVTGMAYKRVISVGESEYLSLIVDENKINENVCFSLQYIDAMRNEYIQKYEIK